MLIIAICTGCPFEIIINAFTISSLFQIIVKLFFAIFSFKINFFIQIALLILMIPFFIIYESFDYFRTLLAKFFWNFVPESAYKDLDPDRDDEFYEDQGDYNDGWYNKALLFFIHFFILIRMFLLSEPVLSIILKFIAIRYFILNEYLFLAYTISLIFIFSRFVFFLSDQTLGYWKLSIGAILENSEESPKITKKNLLILTHWSLRYVRFWMVYQARRNETFGLIKEDYIDLLDGMKEKFNLDKEIIQTTQKNQYAIKGIIFISFLYSINFYIMQDYVQMHFDLIFINRITKKILKIKNESDALLFSKFFGHFGIFRIKNKELDLTTLTTIKTDYEMGLNAFPFKRYTSEKSPIPIKNGFQGISGMSKNLVWKPEFEEFFALYEKNVNPRNFLNFNRNDLDKFSACIDTNVMIDDYTIDNLNDSEKKLLQSLTTIKIPFSDFRNKQLWAIFEKQKYSHSELFQHTFDSSKFIKTIPELEVVYTRQLAVLKNFNPYINPKYIKSSELLNDQTETNSNPDLSGCLDFPFVPFVPFQNQDLDDP